MKTPSGNVLTWGEEAFQEEMERLLKQEAEPVVYHPAHIPLGAIEEENILLVSDASIGELTNLWGKRTGWQEIQAKFDYILSEQNPPF
ncbi:hypothetical protein RCO48_14655 [Peribacillus frigoritolerans]|nr:hypothetical protein [Peribacillus frigoritolerans]